MKAGVLGSVMVGQAISARLAELGHDVMIGTRNPNRLHEWQVTTLRRPGSRNVQYQGHEVRMVKDGQ